MLALIFHSSAQFRFGVINVRLHILSLYKRLLNLKVSPLLIWYCSRDFSINVHNILLNLFLVVVDHLLLVLMRLVLIRKHNNLIIFCKV